MPDFPGYSQTVADAMLEPGDLIEIGLMGFLEIRHVAFGPGTMVAEIDVRDDLLTPFGTLHGGVVSALADHVLGSVMYPVMDRGQWAATTEFKLNLLRPVREGVLTASAEIISMSRRTAVVRIDITNGDRLCAAAQGTVSIQDPR
ncbi:PaaI family thioesterase [Actinospongicola halichondriae]|uniref:PaaI family thioesterase n=1 Tax=Actinospongicola halichondriae TaxID=3236844 RepID=UPI003D4EBCF2